MKLTRRSFLQSSALGTAAVLAPRVVFGKPVPSPDGIIVVIFQRGAMDGLQAIVPYADADYYRLRPTIGIPQSGAGAVLPLDGFFGFNPNLAPILPLFQSGKLAVVHATGIKSGSRSHFQCQDTLEKAYLGIGGPVSGWLNRHLGSVGVQATFQAVGIGTAVQMSLRGPAPAVGMQNIASFSFTSSSSRKSALEDTIYAMYPEGSTLGASAHQALDATDYLALANPGQYPIENGASYPTNASGATTTFATQLKEVAQMIKANIGLKLACVDIGGWDHHDDINADLPPLLDELSRSMLAFNTDLGTRMANVTVIVMTEFGRRAGENGSLGTDHGTGSCMLLMGGGVIGGHVYSQWPGLSDAKLYQGDLDVTIDYRTILSELLTKRARGMDMSSVFPGFTAGPYAGCFSSFVPPTRGIVPPVVPIT